MHAATTWKWTSDCSHAVVKVSTLIYQHIYGIDLHCNTTFILLRHWNLYFHWHLVRTHLILIFLLKNTGLWITDQMAPSLWQLWLILFLSQPGCHHLCSHRQWGLHAYTDKFLHLVWKRGRWGQVSCIRQNQHRSRNMLLQSELCLDRGPTICHTEAKMLTEIELTFRTQSVCASLWEWSISFQRVLMSCPLEIHSLPHR